MKQNSLEMVTQVEQLFYLRAGRGKGKPKCVDETHLTLSFCGASHVLAGLRGFTTGAATTTQ